MKTLYVRIVVTFIAVAFISGIAGLLFSNSYYKQKLLSENETKTEAVAASIRDWYEHNRAVNLEQYLTHLASLGYQFYLVNERGDEQAFGSPFKQGILSKEQYQTVLDGETYLGMNQDDDDGLKLFSFFVNSVRNTVGIPLDTPDGRAALFVRADLQQQIGEVRIILAVLLCATFLTSLLLIVVLTRFIVSPVKQLTKATRQIESGDYELQLAVVRKDEIGDLARDFARMAISIQRSEARRQQFVSNVSHEFQTPLTSIQGLAQAASDPSVPQEESIKYMHIIANESLRLSTLSKQLLKLASLDQEKQLQQASFRLDEQIRQIIIMLEWQWTEKNLELELDLPETIAIGNSHLLYEVWLNLITNAIKFSSPHDTLSVSIQQDPSGPITVIVSDTGEGIPEDELPLLFDRFYKVDQTRNRAIEGSGLGLSIAQTIISLHGGQISVTSTYGEGSKFTIVLPNTM
ncbi:MAG: sensor histidine kinase [Candidatus Pristimantibacillus sp.]